MGVALQGDDGLVTFQGGGDGQVVAADRVVDDAIDEEGGVRHEQ